MSRRLPAALLLALVVSFALFTLMSALVAMDTVESGTTVAARAIDFLRVARDSEVRTKERRVPRRPESAKPPPPPAVRMAPLPKPAPSGLDPGAIALSLADLAAPSAGTALSDMDVVPLVRVPPEYPRRAAQMGIGGWVLLEFTVSAAGTVRDVVVLDSDPPRTFDRAAARAVERFKYRPQIEDGKPVDRAGVRIVIDFDPEVPAP